MDHNRKHRSKFDEEPKEKKVHGFSKSSFPMIRPEKEELYAKTGYNKGGFMVSDGVVQNSQNLLPQVASTQ